MTGKQWGLVRSGVTTGAMHTEIAENTRDRYKSRTDAGRIGLHQYPFNLLIDCRWRWRREDVVQVDASWPSLILNHTGAELKGSSFIHHASTDLRTIYTHSQTAPKQSHTHSKPMQKSRLSVAKIKDPIWISAWLKHKIKIKEEEQKNILKSQCMLQKNILKNRNTWSHQQLQSTPRILKFMKWTCISAAVIPACRYSIRSQKLSQPLSHSTRRRENRRISIQREEKKEGEKECLTAICHASSFRCVPLVPSGARHTKRHSNCLHERLRTPAWLQVGHQWRYFF